MPLGKELFPHVTDFKRRSRPWEVEASNDGDDPFDCDIDWEAAAKTVDAAVSQHNHRDSCKPPNSSDPVVSLQQNTQLAQCQRTNQTASRPTLALGKQPFHTIVPQSNKSMPPSQAMAHSRPSSSGSATSVVVTTRYGDARQAHLPSVLQFDPETVKPVKDNYRQDLVKNAELSQPLLNGWTLFPHQKRAILCGLLMRRKILALDMGLGKTLIGAVWSKAFCRTIPSLTVLVICPVSLKDEWKRTLTEATGLSVSVEPAAKLEDRDDSITDDDKGTGVVYIASWAKIPSKIVTGKYVVVADEAHSMQTMESARTKRALNLFKNREMCVGVLLLTGTPMKNGRPSNLFPLLRAVDHPLGRNQRAYETHFCDGREFRVGPRVLWTAVGSSNVSQLQSLSQSHMLYLTKDECLKNLPKQTRQFHEISVSSKWQMRHNEALRQLDIVYNRGNRAEQGEAVLAAIQRLRSIGSLAKVDAAVQVAVDVLQKEPAIVIFTSFVEVAKRIREQLDSRGWSGEVLTGETAPKKRQGMVDKFQQGLSSVFVCTFGAGGVGLTLTAAHTILLVDRPWTPGEAHQAEDRVRRIGQTKPVRSIWLSVFSVDKEIDRLIQSKSATSSAVLSGTAFNENGPRGSLVPQILEALLSKKGGDLSQSTLDFAKTE